MPTETDKLKIKLIQPTDMFADDAFNNVIKDLDNKVVGIAHLTSGAHWEVWTKNTDYAKGDIVRTPYLKSNQYLECINAGKTGTDCPDDNIPGTMITDNTVKWIIRILGAVDESTISIWLGGEEYGRGSLVLYNNKLYRCKVPHTATTFDVDASKWQEVFASLQEWRATFYYTLNDTVLYNGKLFKCILANDDTVFDSNKWLLINNLSIVHPYEQDTNYMEGQLATVNGKLYKSKTTHLSPTGNFTDDKINWENIYSDIVMWNKNVDYYVGDIVSFDDVMYICKIAHTSSSISFQLDKDNWNIYHTPSSFIKDWVANTVYESEQVVRYKKRIYRCKVKNDDSSWNESNWELINLDIEDWVASTNYYVGQYVSYNGALYRCITANSDSTWTGSNWKKVSGGIDNWVTGSSYSIDDLVIYNDKIYQCKTAHTSTTFNADEANWKEISSYTIHIDNWVASTAYKARDLVVYDAQIYRCTLAHTSTTDLISDIQNWELLSNIQDWESNKTYIQGNIVLYDHTPYKVTKNHVSNDFSLDKDNFELTYSNIRDFNASSYYKAGSYVLYNNDIYKALKDTAGDIGHKLQLQTKASFTDSDGVYTKEIGTDSSGYTLVTEPTGNYINTVIDLGSICDVTQVILSELVSVNCAPNEVVVETSKDGTDYTGADSYSTGGYNGFKDGTALNINKKVRYIKLVFKSIYKSNGNMFTFNKVEVYISNPDWQKITNTQKPSIETWRTGTDYKKNEIVVYNKKIYKCAVDHTSGSDFSTDKPRYWNSLNDNPTIKAWTSNTDYSVNEVVIYNHKLYRCNIKNKGNKFDDVATNWQEITASNNIWMPSMYYDVGDTAIYDTMLYICRTANSDATFTPSNWALVNEYYTIPQYEDNIEYRIGQLVFHDNKILKANQAVKDTSFNSTHWDIVYDSYILPWSSNYQYYQNNICIYNNKLYRCINSNKDATFTPSNWIRLSSGEIEDFKANHNYDENDVFKINNQLYSVKTKFTTTNADISNYIANVEPLIADISKWASNTYYYQGMIVEYQYNLYKCETAHKSSTLFVDEDKSTNTVYWKPLGKLNTQLEYYDSTKTYNINDCVLQKEDYGASKWVSGTTYKVDDIVVYNKIIYKCKTANSNTTFTESNWEKINTEKTVLYRCLKSTANAPSISSTEWEEIDCYIELASDKDIEDLFT